VKSLIIGLFVVGGCAMACAALADTPPAPPARQTAAAAPNKTGFDPNRVVCKQIAVTDSHLPGQRICMTWQQWEDETQAEARDYNDAMHRPGASGVAGGFSAAH
jgi:hypothetical protein